MRQPLKKALCLVVLLALAWSIGADAPLREPSPVKGHDDFMLEMIHRIPDLIPADIYAGQYFEQETGMLHVCIASKYDSALPYSNQTRLQYHEVKYTENEIREYQRILRAWMSAYDILLLSFDASKNKLEVGAYRTDDQIQTRVEALIPKDAFYIRYMDGPFEVF